MSDFYILYALSLTLVWSQEALDVHLQHFHGTSNFKCRLLGRVHSLKKQLNMQKQFGKFFEVSLALPDLVDDSVDIFDFVHWYRLIMHFMDSKTPQQLLDIKENMKDVLDRSSVA